MAEGIVVEQCSLFARHFVSDYLGTTANVLH